MVTPTVSESSRIMIVMELNYNEFESKLKDQFLDDLSEISGCLKEDIKRVQLRAGCVRFEARISREIAERLFELWELTRNINSEDSNLNLELQIEDIEDFKDFINKDKVSEIKVVRTPEVSQGR